MKEEFTKPVFVVQTSSVSAGYNKLCTVALCVVLNDRGDTKS